MKLNELTNEQMMVVDHWLEFKDPQGIWDIEFHPVEGMLQKEVELLYVVVEGPFVPYLCFAESFDEMMDGLDQSNMRHKVDLNKMKSFKVSYWE